MHGAGAAQSNAAAVFGAFELEFVADHPQKWCVRWRVGLYCFAVEFELDHDSPLFIIDLIGFIPPLLGSKVNSLCCSSVVADVGHSSHNDGLMQDLISE